MSHLIVHGCALAARYLIPFLVSLGLTLALTPLVRRFAVKYKFVAYPKQDRWRMRVVATLGGVAIFVSFLVSYILFGRLTFASLGFLFGVFGIFWIGLIDDLVHIKPDTKLIGQIIIACVTIMFGLRFNITASPLINIPLTIIWIVAIINAFNLLDNMDGLSAGVAAISSLILFVHALISHNAQLAVLSVALLGATLGFLRYNFNPAKIFMGDCGSMFLGYILATAALSDTGSAKSGLLITMAVPALVLAVPIFDTVFVTLMRTLHHRPISQGGKDHTSHRLVTLGFSERSAVLFLYLVSALCGAAALLYPRIPFAYSFVLTAALSIGLFIFGVFLGTEVKVYSTDEADDPVNKKRLAGQFLIDGFVYNKRRIVEVFIDAAIVASAYILAFVLRFGAAAFGVNMPLILESLPLMLTIKLVAFYGFGLYRGVWRYIGLYDVIAIAKATLVGSAAAVIALLYLFRFGNYSRTVFVIDGLLTFMAICGVRVLFRLYREFFANIGSSGRRVLIFGAGDAGELVLRELRQNRALAYKPVGFVDDDEQKVDRVIHGVRVLGRTRDIERLVEKFRIEEILITIPLARSRKGCDVRGVCDRLNISYSEVSKIIPARPGPENIRGE
ncbi:MAG: hypothetical protein WCG78_02570 [Candidatus Omnitrophota bacterium]